MRYAALAALLALPGLTSAQVPGPWWVNVGPANAKFHTSAEVSLGGAVVPGAGVNVSSNTTLGLEVGYDLTPNLAARVTVGVPPTTRITGTGPLAGAGELGRLKYGPAVASLTWAFDGMGAMRPYLGAGINYTMMLASNDGAITSLDVENAFGAVLQAGANMPLSHRLGIFLDVKKIFLKTSATGTVGPAPASTSVRLDPLLVHAGLSYRF